MAERVRGFDTSHVEFATWTDRIAELGVECNLPVSGLFF
jgi:hypothetical protein